MSRITAGIISLVAKIGPKLLAIVIKLAKVGKFGLAIGSMVAYTYLFSWKFAIIIMASLFWHESGHLWAMKRCGLKTKGIYFIPLLGAAAVTEDMFKSRRDEVYIAAMGPIWGFILAIGTAGVYFFTRNPFFAAVAGWMAMLNLFNLLPINPLDGGRIMKSITFSINSTLGLAFLTVGIVISMIFIVWARIFLFLLLLVVGYTELLFEYRSHANAQKLIDMSNEPGVKENLSTDVLKGIERLKRLVLSPMSKKGVIISAMVYVSIIVVLWILMSSMANIPEVDIARKLFMS